MYSPLTPGVSSSRERGYSKLALFHTFCFRTPARRTARAAQARRLNLRESMRSRAVGPLILCLALAGLLTAAEQVVLDNGMRLNAERTERQDGRLILYTAGGGSIELDAARVISIEKLPETPQTPDAPAGLPQPSATAQSAASPAAGERPVQDLLTDAALRYGLPPAIVHSVAQAESGYRPSAISPKGAIGVMQLMPGTARQFEADPANVVQNIDAGTRLLRELLLKYQD